MTTLTAAGTGGYSGTITLACGTLPAHLSCAFSATTLTLSASAASQSSTLSIATNVHAAMAMPDRPGALSAPRVFSAMLGFPAMGGLLFLGLSRRRRSLGSLRLSALLLVVSAGACLGLSGCGGGNDNAAKGTYTVPVTFTPSTGTAQTVNVTVNVQ
jgi:hypothetical protein